MAGLCLFISLLLLCFAECGKLLVVPVFGGHWAGMKPLVNKLGQAGHELVVLLPEVMHVDTSQLYQIRAFPVPYTKMQMEGYIQDMQDDAFDQRSFWERFQKSMERSSNFIKFFFTVCESLLMDKELMNLIKEERFEAVLSDPFTPCGSILAYYLSIPLVNIMRGIPCGLLYHASQCPSPPSYVPRMLTQLTDHMTFLQRTINFLASLKDLVLCKFIYSSFEDLAKTVLNKEITIQEVLGYTSIWLLRYDFVFEYPKPLMPNMILVGGINCKPNENLSQVLWKYSGKIHSNVSTNIKLVDWLPQNDLLAHPKTKAFITHGGSNAVYEAICNGVPLVMLPLYGDQLTNTHLIASRGAGISLSITDMSSQDLVDALDSVINDTRYKEAMKKLSILHKDRAVEPLDLAVHWVEFVMKHKGANHLHPAAHELNWIQYHCLDVIGFLLAILLGTTFLGFKCCLCCCRKCPYNRVAIKKPKSE
ncbi:UDP-glucuronosyltransferase 1-6-like isoform X2 [Protopterus annectens]|uniref:UDP-glucuronosyltransferase 1-6-like isoform X2 n=1 Tax=Protopterus annectens TaxID=7888 RepID=UPI001CFA6765|nr:UDP-glucuronosyltransferase 1-6-like isoform X2 [Protopterus annectens]